MKAPISWLRDLVTLPADVTTAQLADQFTAVGLTVEHVDEPVDASGMRCEPEVEAEQSR